jgi:hypothetical protein
MNATTSFRYSAITPTTAIGWITRSSSKGGTLLADLIVRRAERRLHRLAERQLPSVSVHTLKDIGISRSQMPYLVRFSRRTTD